MSLRFEAIEAGAQAMYEADDAYDLPWSDQSERNGVRDWYRRMFTEGFDKSLDTLEANVEEWADRCGNDTGFRPHGYVMNGLITALRPPVSSSQEVGDT